MSATSLEHVYSYATPSRLLRGAGGSALRLATSGGTEGALFVGRFSRPRLAARMLTAVSLVVGARFHIPPAMLARILREADPVVTCGGGRVRFEGFSGCAGVHAHAVFEPASHDGVEHSSGTTNVDFGDTMRAALAAVRDGDELTVRVGVDEVAVDTGEDAVVERRVKLPGRWLRSFLEVQAIQARLDCRFEIPGPAAARFLRSLPRQSTAKHASWIVRSGVGLRLAATPQRDSVRVCAVERLRVLEDLAPDAECMRIYGDPDSDAAALELDFGDRRFLLTISAEVWRGFSGEGATLDDLAAELDPTDLARVQAALPWGDTVDASAMAARLGIAEDAVRRALAHLGRVGAVGFDVGKSAYFRRELPFDLSKLDRMQPRLAKARALVEAGGILALGEEGGARRFRVPGSGVLQTVELRDDVFRCTCTWHAKHQGERGPCAHVLAARMLEQAT